MSRLFATVNLFCLLILQEFVELVKKGNRLEAVRHAKKYLATDENQQLGRPSAPSCLDIFTA